MAVAIDLNDSPSATSSRAPVPPSRYSSAWQRTERIAAPGEEKLGAQAYFSPEHPTWRTATEAWEPTRTSSIAETSTDLPESAPASSRRIPRAIKKWVRKQASAVTAGEFGLVRTVPTGLSLEESFNRLYEFSALEEGWDSYDADRISPRAIATARQLLLRLLQPTPWGTMAGFLPSNIVPLADGGVQFEWLGGPAQLEVEIDTENKLNCFLTVGAGDTRRSLTLGNAEMHEVIGLVSLACGAPVRWRTSL